MEQNTLAVTTTPPAPYLDPLGPAGSFRINGYPALCGYTPLDGEELLYMAWRGSGDDDEDTRLYVATFDGNEWSAATHPKSCHSDASPALCVFSVHGEPRLYMAWRGSDKYDKSDKIYYSWYDGRSWQNPIGPLDGTIKNSPALSAYDAPDGTHRMYMAWHDPNGDVIMWSSFDGMNWTGPAAASSGGTKFTIGSSPALCTIDFADDGNGGASIYLAWRGTDGSGSNLYYSAFDGTTFGARQKAGENMTWFTLSGTPGLCAYEGLLYAIWRGADPDDTIHGSRYDLVGWSRPATASYFTTADNVGLALFGGHMYMAWRGSGDKGSSANTIYAAKSYYTDYANWMERSYELLKNHTLREICIPGAHDAAMYTAQHCTTQGSACNTVTQRQNMHGMLTAGIRYFDLRPTIVGGKWYSGHFSSVMGVSIEGCCGDSLDNILKQTRKFMESGGKELVILKFSHYLDLDTYTWGFNDEQMSALIQQVTDALGPYLFGDDTNLRPTTRPLRDLVGNGSRALAVFDKLPNALAAKNIFSYGDYDPKKSWPGTALAVFDQYAGSNDLETMKDDQVAKLTEPANHGGDLFLFSWTLTLGKGDLFMQFPCVAQIARQADDALATTVRQLYSEGKITKELVPNIVYVDLADGFATAVCMALNEKLLGG